MSKLKGFRSYLLSRLDFLESLDYKRIPIQEIDEAKERHQVRRDSSIVISVRNAIQDQMLEIIEYEEREQADLKDEQQRKETEQSLQNVHLIGIDDDFDVIESNDSDWKKLQNLPGAIDLWNEAKTKLRYYLEDFKVSNISVSGL